MDRLIVPTVAPLENARPDYEIQMNDRLRVMRKSYVKTLREMAEYLGVAISTYAGYEARRDSKNYREPDLDKIIKLAEYFGVTVDYLIGASDVKYKYESVSVMDLISTDESLDDSTKAFLLSKIKSYEEKPLLKASV